MEDVRRTNYTLYKAFKFSFEETFDAGLHRQWFVENWTMSIWYSIIYIVLIFGGTHYMKTRPRFELRTPLVLWSSGLAVFSICGALRGVPELLFSLRENGFTGSVCCASSFYGHTAFWGYWFIFSKLPEMGDTAFIVLRKQPLSLLHWYHHSTVLVYSWYVYRDFASPGRWYANMNFTVHAFMYTYYAAKAMRLRVPRPINIFITSLQIAQMIMGLVVIIMTYYYKSSGITCEVTFENLIAGFIIYISYLVLFLGFFYKTYIVGKPKLDQTTKQAQNGSVTRANGHSKLANGHSNGAISNGVSKSNGHGHSNGHANGYANDISNNNVEDKKFQ